MRGGVPVSVAVSIDEDRDIDVEAILAAIGDIEGDRTPEEERAYLKTLGAPAWLTEDLSAVHTCVSNDEGHCTRCRELGEV